MRQLQDVEQPSQCIACHYGRRVTTGRPRHTAREGHDAGDGVSAGDRVESCVIANVGLFENDAAADISQVRGQRWRTSLEKYASLPHLHKRPDSVLADESQAAGYQNHEAPLVVSVLVSVTVHIR